MEKIILNEYYYEEIIAYLENSFKKIKFTNNLRDKYLKLLLIKYIRIVKAIKLLDLNGFNNECDLLIKSLVEMIIDIAYLELDKNNYERYDLYTYFELYKGLIVDDKDKITDEINKKYKKYINKYSSNNTLRWSGLSLLKEAEILDQNIINPIMPFTLLYNKIYRLNCLNAHNSGLILQKVYKNLKIKVKNDYLYFHNLNYIVILTAILKDVCLPNLFTIDTNIFKSFDAFLGGIGTIEKINNDKNDIN